MFNVISRVAVGSKICRSVRAASIVNQRSSAIACSPAAFSLCKQLSFVLKNTEPTQSTCYKSIYTSTWLAKKKARKDKKSKNVSAAKDSDFEPEDLPQSTEDLVDLEELKGLFAAVVSGMRHEFATQLSLRTSQASFNNFPLELDDGNQVNLQYLAQISMKNPHQVHVNLASNPQYLPKVRDALQNSAFNINPRIEGTSIFIETPRVTREHREKLGKSAKKLGDEYKNMIRDTQNAKLKLAKAGESLFSEDDVRKLQDQILNMAKDYNKRIDEAVKQKQKELLND